MPPSQPGDRQVSDGACHAGANPIMLPDDKPVNALSSEVGEISPTSVTDLTLFPSWTDSNDMPSWYAKGTDVDELLDVAETLDWLADSGDLNETYQPPQNHDTVMIQVEADKPQSLSMNVSTSVTTLPRVDSNIDSIVPSLPDLFDGTHDSTHSFQRFTKSVTSTSLLRPSQSVSSMGAHLQVLMDSPMEEHDFVATILESNNFETGEV
jgi:hypothetical protein